MMELWCSILCFVALYLVIFYVVASVYFACTVSHNWFDFPGLLYVYLTGRVLVALYNSTSCGGGDANLVRVGYVSKIFIYPLQYGKGVKVPAVLASRYGLYHDDIRDRSWVVNSGQKQVTFHDYPEMASVAPEIVYGDLSLFSKHEDPLLLPNNPRPAEEHMKTVLIAKQLVPVIDGGHKVATWIRETLGDNDLRMSYIYTPNVLFNLPWELREKWTDVDVRSNQKQYEPVTFLSSSSLTSLNRRLDMPVSYHRFRPNFMVKGCSAFAEDDWSEIHVGDAVFRFSDRVVCGASTTVDPDSGLKSADRQPLEELAKFRCVTPCGTMPVLGVHMTVVKEGMIRPGDPIYAVLKSCF